MDRGCCYWKWGIVAVAVLVFLGLSGVALGADGASGKAVYEANACSACHGPNGDGGLGPSFKTAEFAKEYANVDKIVETIRKGRGTMPGFPEERIQKDQMDSLVAFILSLSKGAGSKDGASGDASGKGDAEVHYGPFTIEQLYGLGVAVLAVLLLSFFGLVLNGPLKVRR